MESADVRRQVREALTAAKQRAAERRHRLDAASEAWAVVLDRIVVPVARQAVQALSAEGLRFQVSTPGDRVLVGDEHRPEDHVEIALEAADDDAVVIVRSSRRREGVTEERVLVRGAAAIESLADERLLDGLLEALGPWMAR
jgi:hypothetical protein